MSLVKFASFAVQEAWLAPGADEPRKVVAHRHQFDYEPRPGYLYVRSRAISSRCNDNYDEFPASEIREAYRTFIGKPVFVNHNNDDHRRARGVIIDAALHDDVNPDGSDDVWCEVLMEVDAIRFPRLAKAILAGHVDRTSMGTDVAYSKCSFCGNKARNPMEYCSHIPRLKGQRIRRITAGGEPQDILVREICYGLGFFENSLLVEDPADPTAYFLGVDDHSGLAVAAAKTKMRTPQWDEEDEQVHPREQQGKFTEGPDQNDGAEEEAPAEGKPRIEGKDSWTKGTGSKDDPVETDDVTEAADALTQGLYVELVHAPKVCTLLDKLAESIKAAEAQGEKPIINLCQVTVQDTNLFCVESKGIPRVQMPQLKVKTVPEGSRAAAELQPNENGEYDLQPLFAKRLEENGVKVKPGKRLASNLKATQNELDTKKVAGISKAIREDTMTGDEAIFVSNDDYIVDGHHRWAGAVAADWDDADPTDIELDVNDVDMDIISLLAEANRFAEEYGIPQMAVGASKRRPCFGCGDDMTRTASKQGMGHASDAGWEEGWSDSLKGGLAAEVRKRRKWVLTDEDRATVTMGSIRGFVSDSGGRWRVDVKYGEQTIPADQFGRGGGSYASPKAAMDAVERYIERSYSGWRDNAGPSQERFYRGDDARERWGDRPFTSVMRANNQMACDLPGCKKTVKHDSDAYNYVWEVSGGYQETWDFCSAEHQVAFERMFPEWREIGRNEMRAKSRERKVLTAEAGAADDEIPAPPEVDTLRDETCPVCGEKDSYDGNQCSVCQFIKPPEMFNDPDLDAAKEQDLRQDEATTPEQGDPNALPPGQEQADADLTFTPPAGSQAEPEQVDQEEAPDGATPDKPAEDSEDDPEDEDEEDDEDDEEGSGKPDFLKKKKKDKKKKPSQQIAGSVNHGEGADVAMRPALAALYEQQVRVEALDAKIDALARLAGVDLSSIDQKAEQRLAALRTKADVANPAQPVPEPAPEAPYTTTQEEIAPISPSSPEGGSLPDSPTEPGAASVTDVSPDATTNLADTGTVLDEPLDLNEQDPTRPVEGTTEQRPLNETKIETDIVAETGDNSSVMNPITPAFSAQPTTGARVYASLRLARMRLMAGIAEGDDLSLGESIASSEDLTDEMIEGEIETLSKVIEANRRNAKTERPRGLVPRQAAGTGQAMPSMSEVPSMESLARDAMRVQDDEVLFEG